MGRRTTSPELQLVGGRNLLLSEKGLLHPLPLLC